MHLDAGVGGDGVAGFGAACSEALDGPAYLFAVHGGEIAGGWGGEGAGGGGFVVGGGVFEDGGVAALGFDDVEPRFVGGAAAEDFVGELCALFGCGGLAGEVEHPAGEDVGEFDEVGGHGVACARFMMSTHSQTSTQLPEKRPRGSSMVVRSAAVRVPEASPVSTMSSARNLDFS